MLFPKTVPNPGNALLEYEYPELSHDDALEQWINDYTLRYIDEESQILFGETADVLVTACMVAFEFVIS